MKCREDYMHGETVYDLMVNVIFEKANICLESVNECKHLHCEQK